MAKAHKECEWKHDLSGLLNRARRLKGGPPRRTLTSLLMEDAKFAKERDRYFIVG